MKKHAVVTLNKGFTIVELIVVIVVIGILAAITVVSYNVVTENAKLQAVTTDAQTLASKLTRYKADNGGYPSDLSALTDLPQTDTTYQYTVDTTTGTYCLTASGQKSSVYVTNTNSQPKEGGCPGDGVNGQAAIVNLVPNPEPNYNYWFSSSASIATVSFLTVDGYSTARSTRTTTGAYALYGLRTGVATGATGDTYTVIASMKASTPITVSMQVGYGASSATDGTYSTAVTTAWQTFRNTYTLTSASNGQPIYPKFLWSTGAAADYLDVRNVMWVKGNYAGAFGDGNSTNWVWTGTPNASTSKGPAL